MRLLGQLLQFAAARLDQRVQVCGRLAEDVHRQRIPLGLVFHLAQCINGLQEHIVVVLQVPLAVRHLDFQGLERLGCRACPGRRRLHIVCQFDQAALQSIGTDVHQLTGILKFLQLVGGQAGLGGQGQQVICCLAHVHRGACQRSHQAADHGHRSRTAGREAVQLIDRCLQAGRQTDSQRTGQAVDHIRQAGGGFSGRFLLAAQIPQQAFLLGNFCLGADQACPPLHGCFTGLTLTPGAVFVRLLQHLHFIPVALQGLLGRLVPLLQGSLPVVHFAGLLGHKLHLLLVDPQACVYFAQSIFKCFVVFNHQAHARFRHRHLQAPFPAAVQYRSWRSIL